MAVLKGERRRESERVSERERDTEREREREISERTLCSFGSKLPL